MDRQTRLVVLNPNPLQRMRRTRPRNLKNMKVLLFLRLLKYEERWEIFLRRNLVKEHSLRPSVVVDYKIMELLEELGLTKTAINIKPYVLKIMLEFYANLSKNICDATSDNMHLAYIRRLSGFLLTA